MKFENNKVIYRKIFVENKSQIVFSSPVNVTIFHNTQLNGLGQWTCSIVNVSFHTGIVWFDYWVNNVLIYNIAITSCSFITLKMFNSYNHFLQLQECFIIPISWSSKTAALSTALTHTITFTTISRRNYFFSKSEGITWSIFEIARRLRKIKLIAFPTLAFSLMGRNLANVHIHLKTARPK